MSASTPPRTVADRYRFVREVGRGGMGSVWLAVDERLGREVAVKGVGRLPGHTVTDQARALREIRSSAALNHPHVVSVYDAVAEGDHVWLVMEYVEGRTLSELMRAEGPLDPGLVATIGAQVADGLAAAHERGTIHRDVKPGNILVADTGTAKISDFGIARTLGEETLTESGMVTGTPTYFSPELARGQDPGPASDVWALGATLYAAVEGRPPYTDQPNALALLATIAEQRPPTPQRAGVLTEPIGRMLDPDPVSRWSMADAAHALHQRAKAPGEDTRAETHEVPPVPAPAPEPVPEPVAEPVAEPAPEPTPTPAPPVKTQSRRRRRGAAVLVAVVAVSLVALGAVYLSSRDDGTPTAASRRPDASTGSSPSKPKSSATDSPSSATTTPDTTTTSSTGGQVGFVEDYYAVLPDDTRTGWSLLTKSFQQATGTYGDYKGFWDTIDSVEVTDARTVGTNTLDVDLLYNGSDSETRRTVLQRTSDGWKIAGSDRLDR